jgi:hypothetical protein
MAQRRAVQPRVPHLQAARHEEAHGEPPAEGPAGMAQPPRRRPAQHERSHQAHAPRAAWQVATQPDSPAERRAPDKRVGSPGAPEAARGMAKAHGFRPFYPMATLRAVEAPCSVGDDVCAQATEAAPLAPMLARTEPLTGHCLKEGWVDRGDVTGIAFAPGAHAGGTLDGPWQTNDMQGPKAPPLCPQAPGEWRPAWATSRCPAGHLLKRVGRATGGRRGGRADGGGREGGPGAPCRAGPLRPQGTPSHKVGRSLRRSAPADVLLAHPDGMETAAAKTVYR